jgi:TerB N-terminal domain/TerB-C domain/Tellurite resistance protein TerB
MNSEPPPDGQDESPVTVTASVSGAGQELVFSIERPPEPLVSPAQWIGRGEPVVVSGVTISGGLFYLGQTGSPRPGPLDACVVDADKTVAADGGDPSQGPSLAWLSYEGLAEDQRRAYLEWLASQRPGANVHVGYLSLYLYGLERRVIVDGALDALDAGEYEDIASELRRLMKAATDWSFLSHAENLLEVISVMSVVPHRLYRQPPTVKSTRGYQVPLSVRVAFAQAALDRAPVPVEWALAWAMLDSAIARRAPVTRSGEQFRLVFAKKYRERFRDGMMVSVNRTTLTMPDTACPALRERPPPPSLAHLPDVSAASGPRKKLQHLVVECAEALGAYSRYLGRHPGSEGTLEAALVLPYDLWPQAFQAQLESLAARVRGSQVVMTFGELLGYFKSTGAITRAKAAILSGALERSGVAIEPDVRLGARTPKPADGIVLFAAPANGEPPLAGTAYLTASLMIDLAASLAALDGPASEHQAGLIHERVDSWVRFTSAQQTRLRARAALQLSQHTQPATLGALKKWLKPLSAQARQAVAAFLIQTANADGLVTPAQVKMLEKIYRALEFDVQALYASLHRDAVGLPLPSGASKTAGVARSAGVPFVLDDARIAALQRETAQVSMLLADVFAEDGVSTASETSATSAVSVTTATPTASAVPVAPALPKELSISMDGAVPPQPAGGLLGLDDAHSTFLRLLVTRPAWTRAELADAAGRLDLMLDGAIEQVNEASLDHWDEALTEGEDPVEINQALVQRLDA